MATGRWELECPRLGGLLSTGVETKGKLGKRLASLHRTNVGYERGDREE